MYTDTSTKPTSESAQCVRKKTQNDRVRKGTNEKKKNNNNNKWE